MDDLSKKLYQLIQCISKDKNNPSTRLYLSQKLGLSDRACRDLRREAVLYGIPIVSSSQFSGSYLATDKADIQKFSKEAHSRAIKEFETVRACNRMLENWDQLKIDMKG